MLGMSGLLNDSMRASAFAFFPVGVVFLILAMQGRSESDDADGPAGPPGDDDGPPRT